MSKDTIFNKERKGTIRKRKINHWHDMENSLFPLRDFESKRYEPLAKTYEYISGYHTREQKFVYGMIIQIVWKNGWLYCVRPDDNNQEAFWTSLIM